MNNCHGDVAAITDAVESIVNSYKYDAFGNTVEANEQVHNRFRYCGEQYDNVSNQYYLRARFYNPVIGRFTQEDVYRGDGLNLYAYVGNNPINYGDPSGYNAEDYENKENPYDSNIGHIIDSATKAQEKAADLAQNLGYDQSKTIASDGVNNTLSGWGKIDKGAENFNRSVTPQDVINKSSEIGHSLRNSCFDQGIPGQYNASHAEKQLSLLTDNPIGISRAMCDDCIDYFRKLAQYTNSTKVTADPDMVRIFNPDGTITHILY